METTPLPELVDSTEQLEDLLSEPTAAAVDALREVPGDIVVLGAGGKMGPSLARMARRASDAAGISRRVIAVSRFGDAEARRALESSGVETIAADLLNLEAWDRLPDAGGVLSALGRKFGSTGDEAATWATNAVLAARVGERYSGSRVVAFSTGNVYGPVSIAGTGSREDDPLRPVGEYAMSCVGRERVLEFNSRHLGTRTSILRLNYAVELRYGVLVDIARRVWANRPVEITVPAVNVIWQGDASAAAIAALASASSPPCVLNLAGPEILRVHDTALAFGERFEKKVAFEGVEGETALLSDGRRARDQFGEPRVPAARLIRWTAHWIASGGSDLGKPTHFENVDGRF